MNDQSKSTKSETRAHSEKMAAESATYRPPIETVCKYCGGKHVGSCSLQSCSDIGRGREAM